ncbi:hypothetical protein DWUX_1288 [Desulfovibrio diazotrophicus]|nr:hypothetical protein DWUX_1288 [Desulfovibrio diazotrophicus]
MRIYLLKNTARSFLQKGRNRSIPVAPLLFRSGYALCGMLKNKIF